MPGVIRRGIAPGALLVAAALLGLLAAASPATAKTDWMKLRTLHIAHQGGEDEVPSATMYALERAMRLGADMLEVDVHTSKDGKLIVIHDATVDRTTNGSGRVYDKSLAEIQALDAGFYAVPGEGVEKGGPASDYPFRGVRTGKRKPPAGFRPRDFRIPTLAEVMRAYPQVPVNIEIKGAADSDVASFNRNAEALAAYLDKIGRTEGIIVASFNDAALEHFHELAPKIDLAPALARTGAYKFGSTPPPEGSVAFQVPIEFSGVTVVDEPFVQRAHGDGLAVHVWTINDEKEMNQLLDWGVDGIMTAEPIRLEQVLCRRQEKRPDRPAGTVGEHCAKRASIACKADPVSARRNGDQLRVTVRRRDEFAGRCAGRLTLDAGGSAPRRAVTYGFGQKPPSEGGRRSRVVRIGLPPSLRPDVQAGDRVLLTARAFTAFAERSRLRVG